MNNFNDCEPVNIIEQMFTKEQYEVYTTLQKQGVRLPDLWICNPDDMFMCTELSPDEFHDTKLEAIEAWASDEGLICDEDELNEQYRSSLESYSLETLTKMQHDQPMITEDFNAWLGGLESDGQLHPEQGKNYGKDVDIEKIILEKVNQ